MLFQKMLNTNWKAVGTSFVLLFLSIATFAQIQGDGNPTTQDRNITDYKEVLVKLPCDVEIVCQSGPALTITAEGNLLSYITTDVVDGRLVISTTKALLPTVRIKINTTTDILLEMETSTVGRNAYLVRKLHGSDFRLTNYKGDVVLTGNIETANIVVESGNVYGQGLNTQNTIAQGWGGGLIAARAAGVGCGQLSNLATFAYYGTPNLDRMIIQEGPATIIAAQDFPASELDSRMQKVIDRVRGTQGNVNLNSESELPAQKLELAKVEVELYNNSEDRVNVQFVGPSIKRFSYSVPFYPGERVTERVLPGTQVYLESDGVSTRKLLMISTEDEKRSLSLFNETRPTLQKTQDRDKK